MADFCTRKWNPFPCFLSLDWHWNLLWTLNNDGDNILLVSSLGVKVPCTHPFSLFLNLCHHHEHKLRLARWKRPGTISKADQRCRSKPLRPEGCMPPWRFLPLSLSLYLSPSFPSFFSLSLFINKYKGVFKNCPKWYKVPCWPITSTWITPVVTEIMQNTS